MARHGIVKCSCGALMFQCYCPGPHTEEVRQQACESCLAMRPTGDAWEIDLWRRSFEDYTRLWEWMRKHFPCLLAQQPREKLGSQILIELLEPLAARADSCEQGPQATYY